MCQLIALHDLPIYTLAFTGWMVSRVNVAVWLVVTYWDGLLYPSADVFCWCHPSK